MYRSLALSLVSVVSLLAKLLLLGAALDNSSFPSQRASLGATAAVVLLASIPAVWCAPGRRVLVLLTINVLGTSLALADVIHFRYYGDVLSFAEFAHAHQLLVGRCVLDYSCCVSVSGFRVLVSANQLPPSVSTTPMIARPDHW